ncbi:MAG TPA: TetR/AcrR family transcriptional regulator [Candidatus Angelobacter sp.]|jgi:AcrR family transcriptional regulator|nr:TetR/AcrR family transcriptional regulator [Candidatus Angelobacter sp.]
MAEVNIAGGSSASSRRIPKGQAAAKRASQAKDAALAEIPGLRERKKARLRQQIIDTAIRLFRKHGYENTRIDDIIEVLEISQPTFFRYFPTKSAVLIDFSLEGIARVTEELKLEFADDTTTAERLRRFFSRRALRIDADPPLWRAVVLSGAMDPVVSPQVREWDEKMVAVLQRILAQGQERGEVARDLPLLHLAQVMDGLYKVLVWKWAGDITGPHSFSERVATAVEVFLRGIEP